jgi:hypothetical protein
MSRSIAYIESSNVCSQMLRVASDFFRLYVRRSSLIEMRSTQKSIAGLMHKVLTYKEALSRLGIQYTQEAVTLICQIP